MIPHEQLLRDAGLRVTAGRLAVLAALVEHPHSDADSLHRRLAATPSRLTLPAVHNVLSDLAAGGIVRRIEPARSAARYELQAHDNHHHVVCSECGAIADVECTVGHAPCLTPSSDAGYAIATAEVTFWGVCAACAASPTSTTTPSPHRKGASS